MNIYKYNLILYKKTHENIFILSEAHTIYRKLKLEGFKLRNVTTINFKIKTVNELMRIAKEGGVTQYIERK